MGLLDGLKPAPKLGDSVYNTETMLPVSEVRNKTLILKDGSLRAVLKVAGVNMDLKNYEEQEIVLEQYKRFLNGLNFPVQILVRSQYLDLSKYLRFAEGQIADIANPNLKTLGENYLKFLEDIENQTGLVFLKEFYIVVPYYLDESDASNIKLPRRKKFLNVLDVKDSIEKIVGRYRNFLKGGKFLDTRVTIVQDGLAGMGVEATRLENSEIISLLFGFYNPTQHSSQATAPEEY